MNVTMIPLVLALIWLIVANILGALPSKDNHWRRAYLLIALGLPLAIWLWIVQGWGATVLFLVCAASLLRWPLIYAWRWMAKSMRK